MRLHVFAAETLPDALDMARSELGADALILRTEPGEHGVEVTAMIEHPDPPDAPEEPCVADLAETANDNVTMHTPDDAAPLSGAAFDHLVAHHRIPPSLAARLAGGPLAALLAAYLSFGALPIAAGDRPLLLAGPPGAGKTLTVARLATRLVLRGERPAVATSDDRRAGAAEQLAAYTRLLGLDLIATAEPDRLARALRHTVGVMPVLIDTAAGDPFRAGDLGRLTDLADTLDATIAVVLPAGLDPAEAADMAEAYSAIGGRFLIATRLDAARRLGGVLAAASPRADGAALSLAEAGLGTSAPDGLIPMTPALLANRLVLLADTAAPRVPVSQSPVVREVCTRAD
jgi:flagellar biosynthesis protein FlhF